MKKYLSHGDVGILATYIDQANNEKLSDDNTIDLLRDAIIEHGIDSEHTAGDTAYDFFNTFGAKK